MIERAETAHQRAKAIDSVLGSERTLDLSGVWVSARTDRKMRNTGDPNRQPSQAKTQGDKGVPESRGSRKGVRGAGSTDEGGDNPSEGSGPASVTVAVEGKREGMPTTAKRPTDKVRKLRRSLWASAKRNRTRRFHALYGQIHRSDVLWEAWRRVRGNRGACGVDGQTIKAIESEGVGRFLKGIQTKLKSGTYRPSLVKRRYIPKSDGKQRPLGIPTVRDRVAQMAAKLVVEPIFEADFLPCSYGFRPKRNATQALEAIREAGNSGHNFVVDGDIQAYFDSIDQSRLMELAAKRISDRRVLKLIRKWLKAGVMEDGAIRETLAGTPQGGVISPLLANIYLHELDRAWGLEHKSLGTLVRYADDFVVMCHERSQANEARRVVEKMLAGLGLKLHPEKTKVVGLKYGKESFTFLGCVIRKCRMIPDRPNRHFMNRRPGPRAMNNLRQRVHELTAVRGNRARNLPELIHGLNPVLRGWGSYFRSGNADHNFHHMDDYVYRRLCQWLKRRGGQRSRFRSADWPRERFYGSVYGLHRLRGTVSYPAQALPLRPSVSCMRETRTYSLKGRLENRVLA